MFRLAHANGYANPREMWSILSEVSEPSDGVLAYAINNERFVFNEPTPNWLKLPVITQGLPAKHFNRHHLRYCAECIAESNWIRPYWGLNLATVCTKHRCWLKDDSSLALPKQRPNELILALGEMLENAFERQSSSTHSILPMLEQPLSLIQVLRFILYIGGIVEVETVSKPGQLANACKLDVAIKRITSAASILADWPVAFWTRLEQIKSAVKPTFSIKKAFGRSYRVFYVDLCDPEFQGVRDAFELFLREHWHGELCGRNHNFSSENINNQSRISLARAQRELSIGKDALRGIFANEASSGLQTQQTGKRAYTTFDYKELCQLVANPVSYIDLQGTARLLGLSERRVRELVADGVIIADATAEESLNRHWRFRQSVIDEFLLGIMNREQLKTSPRNPVSLGHVLRFMRLSPHEHSESHRVSRRLFGLSQTNMACSL
jgi:hypothetical protein